MSRETATQVDELVAKLLEVIESWPEHARMPLLVALRVDEIVGELREVVER